MEVKSALLWMMVCVAVLQVQCQHWSNGLSPGGLVDLSMCDYVDDTPHNNLIRLKELGVGAPWCLKKASTSRRRVSKRSDFVCCRVVSLYLGMDSHGKCCCDGRCSAPSVHQTLDEMDFERGIWSAALDGDLERVRLLLNKGIEPGVRDQTGYTALHYASRAGHLSVCELLLAHGACANSRTHGGSTALHRAAYCGRLAVARLLLDSGADPSLADDDGSTPLHKAAEKGHVEMCALIVSSCPALKGQKDKRSRSPVDLCPDNTALLELLKPPQ